MSSAGGAVVPLAFILALCALFAGSGLVVRGARRHRWQGDIRPRASPTATLPWRSPGGTEAVMPPNASASKWGDTAVVSVAKVRAPGQLRWHQATVFVVNGGLGLVVDPYLSWSRRYVFDESCHVGPTNAVMTFAVGGTLRLRDFSAIRVAGAAQTIDLAVRTEDVPAILAIGQPSPIDVAEHGRLGRRIAFIGYCDRLTARRRGLAGSINAQSRVRRPVAAACSLGCLALAAVVAWVSDLAYEHHLPALGELGLGVVPLLVGVVVYAIRMLRPKTGRTVSD